MFVQTTRAGRAAALLTSGVLAVLLITGSASPRTTYHITDGETVRTVTGKADDTQGALALAGVTLSQRDRVTSQVQTDGSVAVTVERPVTTYEEQVVELLPYDTLRQADPDLPLGEELVVQTGVQGAQSARSRVGTDPDGSQRITALGTYVSQAPVDEIVAYGTQVEPVAQSWLSVTDDVLTHIDADADGGGTLTTASGTELTYTQVLSCKATAYTTQRQSWKKTATGTTARVGAIAVDPDVIPYGTRMFIVSADGSITYGVATAEDCGGSIQGNRIDLFFDTYDECIQFGVRSCDVYLLA